MLQIQLNTLKYLTATLAALLLTEAQAELIPSLNDALGLKETISVIQGLESQRDPKCAATASRLEDFMFGTPLTDGARNYQIERQKHLIRSIWLAANELASSRKASQITQQDIEAASKTYIQTETKINGDIQVTLMNKYSMLLEHRDIRQYGSVAYALRAILSVQQDISIEQEQNLLPLEKRAIALLKEKVDLVTLSLLKRADFESRKNNKYTLTAAYFESVWNKAFGELPEVVNKPNNIASGRDTDFAMLRNIIQQKLKSYQAYNNISTPVFLRNIQVYFARHPWPTDQKKSLALKSSYNQSLIFYALDLYQGVENVAKNNGHAFLRPSDVQQYTKQFVPVEIDEFEDATFFPKLPAEQQIKLAAYDMDAFRDSGLHWNYLEAALNEKEFIATMEADPFAAELLVENITQFGVLVLRIAGDIAAKEKSALLHEKHLLASLQTIQQKINLHSKVPEKNSSEQQIASASNNKPLNDDLYFTDVTNESGIQFKHRMADWLNRLIRSYSIRNKDTAVLAVPPAFGGSGVAAEDINDDGLADLLLVGGLGNKLYLNSGGGSFKDITDDAGINWKRATDGLPGEPRQPIIADFDNDGIQDIFISYAGDSHKIYRGKGNAQFEDVTVRAGLGGEGLIGGPALAMDYDNDGLLDLYITYFGQYNQGIGPTLARHNINGLPNKLFRNMGNMVFKDVTKGSGTANTGWTQAASHTDLNRDGWQDLIVGNDFGVNAYLINQKDGSFINAAEKLGTGKPSFTMNVGIGDLNDDLYPDIYISNIVTMDKDQKYINPEASTPMKLDAMTLANLRVSEANDLFLSVAKDNQLSKYQSSDLVGRGYSSTGWAWGADFFDFDNDTDNDLYVTNGMNDFAVYSSQNPYYEDPDGNKREAIFPESQKDSNVFFENEGGRLINASEKSGADLLGNSRAVIYMDIENDGDLDMILNNFESEATVYRNNAEKLNNHWIAIKLEGDPEKNSNRDAIGARIIVTANKQRLWREVHGGVAYLSMHPKQQHFGLGMADKADVRIEWPSGAISDIKALDANQVYLIKERENKVLADNI